MIKLHLYVLLIVSFTCCQLLVEGDLGSLEPSAKRIPPSLGVGEGRTEGFNAVPTPPSPTVPIIKPGISEIHWIIKNIFKKYANKIQIISKTPNPQPLPERRPIISDVFCQFCQSLLTLKIPLLSAIPNPQQTTFSSRSKLFIVDDYNWELIGRFYRCEHVACADSYGLAPVFFTDVQILTSTNENSQCSFQKTTLSDKPIFTTKPPKKLDTKTDCQHCKAPLDAIFKHGNLPNLTNRSQNNFSNIFLSNSNIEDLTNHYIKDNFFFTKKEDCKLIIGGLAMTCANTGNKTKGGHIQYKAFHAFRKNFTDCIFKSLVKKKCPSIIFASELGLKKEGDKWTYTIKDSIDPSSPLAQVSSPCFSTKYPSSGIDLLPPQDNTHSLFQNFTKIDDSEHPFSLSTTQTDLYQYLAYYEINSTHLPFPHPLPYNDPYNTWPSLTSGGFTHSFNQASSPYFSTECPNLGIDLFQDFTEKNDSTYPFSLSTTQMNLDLFYSLDQYLVSDEINSTHLPFLHSSCYNDPYNTWPSLTSGESTHSFNQASLPYVSTEYPNPEIGHSDDVLSFGFTASEIEYLSFITL